MIILNYIFSNIGINIVSDSKDLIELIEKDSQVYLTRVTDLANSSVDFTINFKFIQEDIENVNYNDKQTEDILLHPRDINLYGIKWVDNDSTYIYNPHYPAIYEIHNTNIVIRYNEDYFNAFMGFRMFFSPNLYKISDYFGSVTLHASSVEKCGKAYLFCGPKGAGKTSCSLSLALVNSFGFITNDYSILKIESENNINIIGPPEPIRVADGTYRALLKWLEGIDDSININNKKLLLMRDFYHKVHLVPSAKVEVVFLVELSSSHKISMKKIKLKSEAINLLSSQLMEIHGYNTPDIWKIDLKLDQDILIRNMERILSNVNIVEIKVPYSMIGNKELGEYIENYNKYCLE